MPIDLTKDQRQQALASIERYFLEDRDERIGNIASAALLNFFMEEIGPAVYNQAVADVQERIQQRVADIDIEVHEEPFGYWQKRMPPAGRKR